MLNTYIILAKLCNKTVRGTGTPAKSMAFMVRSNDKEFSERWYGCTKSSSMDAIGEGGFYFSGIFRKD